MEHLCPTSPLPAYVLGLESPNDPPGVWRAFRAYIKNKVTLTNAVYNAGLTNVMGHVHNHNLSIPQGLGTIANRVSTLPMTKMNDDFETGGSEVTLQYTQELYRTGGTDITGGTCRIVIFPFRRGDVDDDTRDLTPKPVLVQQGDFNFYSTVKNRVLKMISSLLLLKKR